MDNLEEFIDNYFYHEMNANKQPPEGPLKPAKIKKTDSSTDTDDLLTTEIKVSVLDSINNELEIL